MSEEFIEDIIATNDEAKATDAVADANVAADSAIADTTESVEDKSDSTTVEAEPKATTATDSEGSDVAPTDTPEVEELASKLGWNKDHKGAETVDAATYILRSKDIQKTMKDHNKDLKSQLTGVQGSIDALKEHNERVYQADVKKLQGELVVLKKEKKAAVELADVAKVEELDQQIDDVKNTIDAPTKVEPSANPVYDEWVADNQWYLTDPAMAAYADKVADQYDGAPVDRVYALVKQKVAEVFPDKFESKADTTKTTTEEAIASATKAVAATEAAKVVGPTSPVEKGSRTSDSVNFTKADLSADQLTIMNQFVRGGIMTEDQYVADIAKMQGA